MDRTPHSSPSGSAAAWHLPFAILMMLLFAVTWQRVSGAAPAEPVETKTTEKFQENVDKKIEGSASAVPAGSRADSGSKISAQIADVFSGTISSADQVQNWAVVPAEAGSDSFLSVELKELFNSGTSDFISPVPAWVRPLVDKVAEILNANESFGLKISASCGRDELFEKYFANEFEFSAARATVFANLVKKRLTLAESRIQVVGLGCSAQKAPQVKLVLF